MGEVYGTLPQARGHWKCYCVAVMGFTNLTWLGFSVWWNFMSSYWYSKNWATVVNINMDTMLYWTYSSDKYSPIHVLLMVQYEVVRRRILLIDLPLNGSCIIAPMLSYELVVFIHAVTSWANFIVSDRWLIWANNTWAYACDIHILHAFVIAINNIQGLLSYNWISPCLQAYIQSYSLATVGLWCFDVQRRLWLCWLIENHD